MSVLSVAPEFMETVAADLSGIGSSIHAANAAAAASTAAVVAPAADSVSAKITQLFGQHAASYQTASAQGQLFHRDFVTRFTSSGTAYLEDEQANASTLGNGPASGVRLLGNRQHQTKRDVPSRLWQPGMPDPRLTVPQHTGLTTARSRLWQPGLGGVLDLPHLRNGAPPLQAPHSFGLGGRTATGGIPVLHEIRKIVYNQINYLKQVATSLENFVKDEISAIMGLPAAFEKAFTDLVHGNIAGSISDINKGFLKFFVNGVQYMGAGFHFDDDGKNWYKFCFTGPMADLWQLMQIPAQEMQTLADTLKPLGFGIMGGLVQHLADPLESLANAWDMYVRMAGDAGSYGALRMGKGLALTFDLLGAPILSMRAFADSLQTGFDNLMSGHFLKAGIDVLTAPVNILHAFLFGQGYLQLPLMVSGDYGSKFDERVHLGGIFAPLGPPLASNPHYPDWTESELGTQTGGLLAGIISMLLPPKH